MNWNDVEMTRLVEYLWEHRSEAGDGGSFKATTWNAAATYLAPYQTAGPVKSGKQVKGKYMGVSIMTFYGLIITDTPIAQNHF